METEDPRLGQLEVAVQELRHQNTKFEGWFTQAGHKTNELTNQVHALCATVDSQQKDIQAIRQEAQDQPNQIQTAMQTALQTMGSLGATRWVCGGAPSRFKARFWSNPSGMRGKELQALDLGPGLWFFTETQLSEATMPSVRRSLQLGARQQHRQVRVISSRTL